MRSFPCLIVEAKPPEVAAEVGYHEGQMYAAYLKQNYPTGINPGHFVLATNRIDFLAGYLPELQRILPRPTYRPLQTFVTYRLTVVPLVIHFTHTTT